MIYSEKDLQNQLVLLSSHIRGLDLVQEFSVPASDDCIAKSRRFDIVLEFTNKVWVIELKSRVITWQDVGCIIGERAYIDIANKFFEPKSVMLMFISPFGIEPSASRLIQNNNNVIFCSPALLANSLIKEYENRLPSVANWRVNKLREEFSTLLNL